MVKGEFFRCASCVEKNPASCLPRMNVRIAAEYSAPLVHPMKFLFHPLSIRNACVTSVTRDSYSNIPAAHPKTEALYVRTGSSPGNDSNPAQPT